MADIEKVIKGLECCLKESDHLYSNPCNGCPYEGQECIDRMKADALALLKEQQEKIHQLESMNVSASGNGTAIGVLHGGMTIKKEYHQQAKEVYNIGHIDRLDL